MCRRVLVLGFGNPGRKDDGLGPLVAARVEAMNLPGVTTQVDYQLSIEHADLVSQYDTVVFADAAKDAETAYYFRRIAPETAPLVSSHHVPPSIVLGLARDCFDRTPKAYLLGIRAHDLDQFHEGITDAAGADLEEAIAHLVGFLRSEVQPVV